MSEIYVSTTGSDLRDGKTEKTAVKSLDRARGLAVPGDTIKLKRGGTWRETLTIDKPNIRVGDWGTSSSPPKIDGQRSGLGVLVRAPNTVIEKIWITRANGAGILVQGVDASASIFDSLIEMCGSGIVAGGGDGGGLLRLVKRVVCRNADISLGAGDGIQLNENATDGEHVIEDYIGEGNARGGLNVKAGVVRVRRSLIRNNGETGANAQLSLRELHLTECVLAHNNQIDNGVGTLTIEDTAKVFSKRSVYMDPRNGEKATVLVNVWTGTAEFHSEDDVFVALFDQTNMIGGVMAVHTRARLTRPIFRINAGRETIGNVETVTSAAPVVPPDFDMAPEIPMEPGSVRFRPKAAWQNRDGLGAGGTFSVLVTSKETFTGRADFEWSMRTLRQTRINNPPNTWECAWAYPRWFRVGEIVPGQVLQPGQWGYYVLGKNVDPTVVTGGGVEWGKSDPVYTQNGMQRMLHPIYPNTFFPLGEWKRWRCLLDGNHIQMWCDGQKVIDFTDEERPLTEGKFGLYCEDALVEFRDVTANGIALPFGTSRVISADGDDFGVWHVEWLGGGRMVAAS